MLQPSIYKQPFTNAREILLLFTGLVLLSLLFYSGMETFFPSHIHAWTQSDRLALAYGFLDNGFNFFKPQTFNLATKNGITGVDFPIHEYLVALLMKIFNNRNPLIFRLYTLGFCYTGYLSLFLLLKSLTGSFTKSMAGVCFVFTLPVLGYFQFGFIPSVTAFSSCITGIYFYTRYLDSKRKTALLTTLAFISLSALVRSTYIIYLVAILLHFLLSARQQKKISISSLLLFIGALAIVIGYALYNRYLNKVYGSQFLTSFLPADDWRAFFHIVLSVIKRWWHQYFTISHYIVLLIMLWVLRSNRKTLHIRSHQLVVLAGIAFPGSVLFFILMAKQFVDHEYYFADSFYPVILLLVTAGIQNMEGQNHLWKKIQPVLWLLLLTATIESYYVQKEKYSVHQWDRGEITRTNFTGSAAFLDSLKVPATATILVIDAYSTNAPLLLMNRKGYTVLTTSASNIKQALTLPFEYIVIQDVFLPSEVLYHYPLLASRLKRLGGNGRISVFRYHKDGLTPASTVSLLGMHPYLDISTRPANLSSWTNLTTTDSSGMQRIDNATVYGPTCTISPNQVREHSKLLFGFTYRHCEKPCTVNMVLSVENAAGKSIQHTSMPIRLQPSTGANRAECLFVLPASIEKGSVCKCFIWNEQGCSFSVSDLVITVGNN
jgi:Dolichyl-phosphate-mannose-protein mannosyltransferase